jgi:hypothetical protein
VAGTAVGTTYGIAKKANVVAVRVLNCQGSGFDDDFIAAFNWIRTNAQKPAVVNYSIGCTSRCTSQAPRVGGQQPHLVGDPVRASGGEL